MTEYVRDVMTKDPITLDEAETANDAAKAMKLASPTPPRFSVWTVPSLAWLTSLANVRVASVSTMTGRWMQPLIRERVPST